MMLNDAGQNMAMCMMEQCEYLQIVLQSMSTALLFLQFTASTLMDWRSDPTQYGPPGLLLPYMLPDTLGIGLAELVPKAMPTGLLEECTGEGSSSSVAEVSVLSCANTTADSDHELAFNRINGPTPEQ
ncbi:unnamed protein product, partial [Polarella glacialis]